MCGHRAGSCPSIATGWAIVTADYSATAAGSSKDLIPTNGRPQAVCHVHQYRDLCRDLRRVLSLGSLFRYAKHRSDLCPAAMSSTGGTDRISQFLVHLVAPLDQFSDGSQRFGVRQPQVCGINMIGPFLQRLLSLRSCLAHLVHQSFKNLSRASMAWIIAAPSSSATTPTSKGAPLVEGPMNIVTAGSSVS